MQDIVASGLERMFHSSHDEWVKNHIENILVGQGPTMAFAPELKHVGYTIHEVPPIRTFKGSMAFRDYVRETKPDVVHIQTEQASIVSPFLTRLVAHPPKVVRTVHAVFDATGQWGVKRRITALVTGPLVAANTAVSAHVQSVEESFGRSCVLITNWVDPKYQPLPSRHIPTQDAMALVGNCSEVKNHEVVLRAALTSRIPVHHLGSEEGASAEERSLLSSLESLGLLLTRGVHDPLPVLLQGPVFCLPSKNEGLPISLLEALTTGNYALVTSARSLDWTHEFPTVARADWQSSDSWSQQFNELLELRRSSSTELSITSQGLAASKFGVEAGVKAYSDLYRGILAR